MERRTRSAAGIHSTGQTGTERFCRELQRAIARRMPECQLVHELERCTEKNRRLAARLQPATSTQFVELSAARGVCQNISGDAGMSGKFTKRGSEAVAQTPPLLRASSPLKPKNQPRTNIETGTANGGTSVPPELAPIGSKK